MAFTQEGKNTMRLPRYALRFFSIMMLAFFLPACTTNEVSVTAPVVKAKTILLLPVDGLYDKLVAQAKPVDRKLAHAFSSEKFQVIQSDREVYKQAVDQALEISGAIYDPEIGKFIPADRNVYWKALIDIYAVNEDYDVIIMPELVIRDAVVDGDYAEWDGARRRIELAEKAKEPYHNPEKLRGLSVKLSAFTAGGVFIIQSHGGVSLPYLIDYNRSPPYFKLKKTLFTDSELDKGVDTAVRTVLNQVKYHDK